MHMPRYRFRGFTPQIPASTYVADTASVIGRVILGEDTSVWPGAVIRADSEPITIGDGSNVQDNAVLHVDPGVPMTIGRASPIGHQVMLHGCTIGDGSLIGIQAIVLNHAVIGESSPRGGRGDRHRAQDVSAALAHHGRAGQGRARADRRGPAMLRHAAETYIKRSGLSSRSSCGWTRPAGFVPDRASTCDCPTERTP